MDQPAEAIATLDVVWSRRVGESERWLLRVGRREVEGAVGPVAIVVVDEDAEHLLEVAPVEDQEPVETFRAGGADEALRDRVRLRRSHRRPDDLDALASEDGVEVT
jgi:hypothetical protein